jgi:hypothetical protein
VTDAPTVFHPNCVLLAACVLRCHFVGVFLSCRLQRLCGCVAWRPRSWYATYRPSAAMGVALTSGSYPASSPMMLHWRKLR